MDEFAELMVSTHANECPWRVSAPHSYLLPHAVPSLTRPPARPCGSQTHVFGDSSIRLKDARGDGDDTGRGPHRRVVDAATAVSMDEQVEARRVGRMYVPEVDHDGF